MRGELRFAGVDWASEEHAVCVVDEQAMRPRYSVAGGKSDRFDSFVLASSLAPTLTASAFSSPTGRRPRRCGR